MTFTIHEVPLANNRAREQHWAAKRRQAKRWRLLVLEAVGRRSGTPPERVRVEVRMFRHQRQDPDNRVASVKSLLDALVHCGWLRDDRSENCELDVLEDVDRRNQRTQITLEDL